MTNRLPKQEPETVNVQSFMEQHLANFIKDMIKEGTNKKIAIQWAADRFQKGGKHNLQSVESPFLKRDSDTGMITQFRYEEGQVYAVASVGEQLRGLDEIRNAYTWDDEAMLSLTAKVADLAQCTNIMIWRMYNGMTASVEGGINFIVYVGGVEEDLNGSSASLVGDHTGTLMVSAMNLLIQHDVLRLVGESM